VNDVAELLADLSRNGITLEPRGETLAYRPRNRVTRELKARLQAHKSAILELLTGTTAVEQPARPSAVAPPRLSSPVSAVILDPQLETLEPTLLSLLGQQPAPQEILIVGRQHRRIRKIILRFGSRYWRNAMYHELLDDWPRIDEMLDEYPIIGTHRRQHNEDHRIYPDGQSESSWHFAGTFFWFRNADVFSTDRWRQVWQATGRGAEAWPGRMFEFEQSACVAYDGLVEHYNPDSYDPQIEDD
jgi:hypothetical protein